MADLSPCRRCLLEDMLDERALRDIIAERIRLLPDDQRAGDEEYAQRLKHCRTCDQLISGTCAQCGCYVEIRAAKRGLHCPHGSPKW